MAEMEQLRKQRERRNNILFGIGLVILVWIVSFLFYKNVTLGSDPSDYKPICIEGHTYYRANFIDKGFLSIALDENGKPVKCK